MPRGAPHQIDVVAVGKNSLITLLRRGKPVLSAPPRMNHDVFRSAGNKNFIPANCRLAVLVHQFLHAPAEVRLQFFVRFKIVRPLEFLNLRIRVPRFSVHFVAADMEIVIGKKLCHLSDKFVEKFVKFLVRRIHRRIHDSPLLFHAERPGPAGKFRIAYKPRSAVAWHIELRYNAHPAIPRVGDHIANFFLRVVHPFRACTLQLRKFLALRAKSLVVRNVPVENVQFHRFHSI